MIGNVIAGTLGGGLPPLVVDYLVVAGGGGGGSQGGGGGAGGLRCTVTATGGGGSLESALSLLAVVATAVHRAIAVRMELTQSLQQLLQQPVAQVVVVHLGKTLLIQEVQVVVLV